MGSISERLGARRTAIGMSKAALARALGVDPKQISRWEGGTTPPAEMLPNLAKALNFSVAELMGLTPTGLDLSGEWYAVWDTTRDGVRTLNRHELHANHLGEFVYMSADGDYDWLADLRLRGSTLTGSYQAVAEHRNECGALHLTLDHHGVYAIGHWIGSWADGIGGSGFGVIARDPEVSDRQMKKLLDQGTYMIYDFPESK